MRKLRSLDAAKPHTLLFLRYVVARAMAERAATAIRERRANYSLLPNSLLGSVRSSLCSFAAVGEVAACGWHNWRTAQRPRGRQLAFHLREPCTQFGLVHQAILVGVDLVESALHSLWKVALRELSIRTGCSASSSRETIVVSTSKAFGLPPPRCLIRCLDSCAGHFGERSFLGSFGRNSFKSALTNSSLSSQRASRQACRRFSQQAV